MRAPWGRKRKIISVRFSLTTDSLNIGGNGIYGEN